MRSKASGEPLKRICLPSGENDALARKPALARIVSVRKVSASTTRISINSVGRFANREYDCPTSSFRPSCEISISIVCLLPKVMRRVMPVAIS